MHQVYVDPIAVRSGRPAYRVITDGLLRRSCTSVRIPGESRLVHDGRPPAYGIVSWVECDEVELIGQVTSWGAPVAPETLPDPL
jgi:hypothetical protein